MKKVLPIVLVMVVLVAGGWLFLGRSKKEPAQFGPTAPTAAPETSNQPEQSFTGKIKDALGLGVPMKCEWETDETNFGATWIEGKKMYNEVSVDGTKSYTILKDDCLWSWTEEGSEGMKLCFELTEEEAGVPDLEEQGQATPPSDIDYHCQPDVFTAAKFDPPTNIDFVDMSQLPGIGQ